MRKFFIDSKIVLLMCLIGLTVAISNSCGLFRTPVNILTEVRTLSNPEGTLIEPFGIAFSNGAVFVSDGEKGTIVKIDSSGTETDFAKGFKTPSHIAFSESGDLFVADSGDHTIRKVSPDGSSELVAGVAGVKGFRDGNSEQALFNAPVGISAAGDRVFVSDTYNDRIRLIKDGLVTTVAGGEQGFEDSFDPLKSRFNTPTGLAVLNDDLLIADTGNRRIRLFDKEGVRTIAGTGNRDRADGLLGDAAFAAPTGLAVDRNGAIYVSDGNAVRVVGRRLVPLVETLAGGQRGFADTSNNASRFNRVSGIGFDGIGNLLVADSDNGLVRIVTGTGTGNRVTESEYAKSRPTAKEFRDAGQPRWPYRPAARSREIAGTLGEIRGEVTSTEVEAWFHNGLDIVGGYGETARMVRSEKILRPESVGEFATKRENVRFPKLGYIHIRLGRSVEGQPLADKRFQFSRDKSNKLIGLRIPRGSYFKAGEAIGTLNTMNHVHLIAGPAGSEMNALDAIALPGASDSRPPVIEQVDIFEQDWRPVETVAEKRRINVNNRFRLVARAYDQMDGNAARRKLGVYKLGYQVLNGDSKPVKGFENPKWTIIFDKTPANESVGLVYAAGSRSGATGKTKFNYIVSNDVSGRGSSEGFVKFDKAPGTEFVLRVFAADYFGNSTYKDIEVTAR